MKQNELKRLLKTIQFRTEKTIEEIAGEIGYARAYLNDQVNKGKNETLKNVLLKKYATAIEQDVSYNTPVNSLQPRSGQNSQKTSKDTDILTTVTTKPDYGMKLANGTKQVDKDATIHNLSEATNSQQKLIAEMATKLMDFTSKVIEKM